MHWKGGKQSIYIYIYIYISHGMYDSLTEAALTLTHWRTDGLGFYTSLHFPQWFFSHRHCAWSARMRNMSCQLCCWLTRNWVSELMFLLSQPLLAHLSEEGPPFSRARHHVAPASRSWNLHLWFMDETWQTSVFLSTGGGRLTQTRALSTRRPLALELSLFAILCSSRWEDPKGAWLE